MPPANLNTLESIQAWQNSECISGVQDFTAHPEAAFVSAKIVRATVPEGPAERAGGRAFVAAGR